MSKTYFVAVLGAAALILLPSAGRADNKYKLPDDDCTFADSKTGKLLPSMEKVYALHLMFEIYRLADTNCKGVLTDAQIAKYLHSKDKDLQVVETTAAQRSAEGKPITLDAKTGQPTEPLLPTPKPDVPKDKAVASWNFLVRDSSEDIGVWQRPKKLALASGAQFGFASDAAAANQSWSAQGVTTAVYSWLENSKDFQSGVLGFALAPWVSFNRLTNSNTAPSFQSKQTDVLSFGGTTELGYRPSPLIDHYFRLKGSLNTNFEFNVRSWSMTGEWQPVSNQFHLSAPVFLGQAFTLQIDPIARVQTIQRLNGSLDPIFAQHNQVWRAGPVVSYDDGFLPKFLQNAALNLSYSALFDTYTGKDYYFLNTSLTIPFDKDGHVGAKLSYQRGYNDPTAIWIDQFLVGLAVNGSGHRVAAPCRGFRAHRVRLGFDWSQRSTQASRGASRGFGPVGRIPED